MCHKICATFSAGLRLWRPWFTQKNEAPKIQLRGLGSAVNSPSGVWGGAPAEIEFGVLWPKIMRSGVNYFNYFPENQLTKFFKQ